MVWWLQALIYTAATKLKGGSKRRVPATPPIHSHVQKVVHFCVSGFSKLTLSLKLEEQTLHLEWQDFYGLFGVVNTMSEEVLSISKWSSHKGQYVARYCMLMHELISCVSSCRRGGGGGGEEGKGGEGGGIARNCCS